jgi:DNA polymerase III alpha subunit
MAKEIKLNKNADEIKLPTYETQEWDRKEFLLSEREILGRTISGSLHEVFGDFFRGNSSVTALREVKNLQPGDRVKIEVIINSKVKEFTIKKGKRIGQKFAKYLVEDSDGSTAEITVWNDDYEKYNHILKDGLPIKAICKVDEYMEQKGLSLAFLEGVLGKEI